MRSPVRLFSVATPRRLCYNFQVVSTNAKVYTKSGDTGQTGLLYGGRVSKNNPHTEAYGMTDEAVSAMGLARALSEDAEIKAILKQLQREMFTVGAELATHPDHYETYQQHFTPVTAEMVAHWEETIDRLLAESPLPPVFILPGASGASAAMDMARCMTRTAERRVVALYEAGGLTNPEILRYVNRVGDLLFVLARYHDRHLPLEKVTGDQD